MIVIGGWPGRVVVGLDGAFGVRPAAFAVGGDFDNPLANDVDAGDSTTEFVLVATSLPSSGTVTLNDDGGYSLVGAADGTHTTTATFYTWPQGGPITQHVTPEQIVTTVGTVTNPKPMLSSPNASPTGPTTGAASITTDIGNGVLYRLVDTAANATASAVKVGGSQTIVAAAGVQPSGIGGLTPQTAYYVHWLQTSASGADSDVVTAGPFTTPAVASGGAGTALIGLTAGGELILILGVA